MNARMHNHWVLTVLNAFVHIFVYGYFAAKALGTATADPTLILHYGW